MREKRARGFAAMDPAKQREIASKGGRAAHVKGTAHEFTAEEAAAAGRKGGKAAHEKGTAHEFSREEAVAAGRKRGEVAQRTKAAEAQLSAEFNRPGVGGAASGMSGAMSQAMAEA
jgi:general stress protein YciG